MEDVCQKKLTKAREAQNQKPFSGHKRLQQLPDHPQDTGVTYALQKEEQKRLICEIEIPTCLKPKGKPQTGENMIMMFEHFANYRKKRNGPITSWNISQ